MNYALITGGAKKLGKALSLTLSSKYSIVIHYKKSKGEAEELKKEIQKRGGKAETIFGDFSNEMGVHAFIQEFKKRFSSTHALIHNASQYLFGSFLEAPLEKGLHQWNTDFLSALILTRELSPKSILFLGVAGILNSLSDTRTSFYTLSKLNLLMLTKSLARELAPKQVQVNMISPGYLEESVDLPSAFPMKRPAEWQEVADAALFLLSNSYITGQNLEIAGGVRL